MTTELYKEVKLFKGLKNDEDPKQISHEYFSDMKNFNYPDTGILGINKILSPEIIKTFDIANYLFFNNSQTIGATVEINGIAYSPYSDNYIALGNDMQMYISTDLISWISVRNQNEDYKSICYDSDNKYFRVCCNATISNVDRILKSTDGINWTVEFTGSAPETGDIGNVVLYSPDFTTLIEGTNKEIRYNYYPSGIFTWHYSDTPVGFSTTGIVWSPELSLFVAVGYGASTSIMTSTNVANWTSRLVGGTWTDYNKIAWSSTLGMFVVSNGYYSTDGINWTAPATALLGKDICWDSVTQLFYIVGDSGLLLYSADGITWAQVDSYTNNSHTILSNFEKNKLLIGTTVGTILNVITPFQNRIDGMVEYKFLDSNQELKIENIGVINGILWKNILSSPIKLTSAFDTFVFSNSKSSFAVYKDKLFIANGNDYPYVYDGNLGVVSQMGAPFARIQYFGNVTGVFSYAMTYVTAGGEEVIGTISNTINASGNKVILNLPLGYSGVTSRKIYRAYDGLYKNLDLLATISDNTTLTYIDDAAYTPVIAPSNPIPDINNELPKPYFIKTFNNRILFAKCDKTPTQFFVSDAGIEVIDSANFIDISNYGDDNTPINGMDIDFSNVMIGTEKHWYLVNIGTSITITPTRVNVGIKDGYSLVRLPSFADFPGGLMFVSNNNDIRILNGLDALPVSTSVNNVRSDNWAQDIRGTLENDLKGYSNIYSIYYNYRYHLVIDGNKYVFDIRTQGWTYHSIETENYKSNPYILAVLNNELYNGQVSADSGNTVIEKEYASIKYKDEEVPAYIESPQINVSDKYKFVEKIVIWFLPNEDNKFNISVKTDDESEYITSQEFQVLGGAFDVNDFYPTDFQLAKDMEYKVFNIQKPLRWFKFKLENNKGISSIQGWRVYFTELENEE